MAKFESETIAQFAVRIQKSESTVRRLVKTKQVAAKRKRIVLSSKVTKRYLASKTPAAPEPAAESPASATGPATSPAASPAASPAGIDKAVLRRQLANYIERSPAPILEAFAAQQHIAIELLYDVEFDELLSKQKTKVISSYYSLFLSKKIRYREFRELIAREEARPLGRNPKRMYQMMTQHNWIGPEPHREELFAMVDYEKKILGSASENKISKADPPPKKSPDPSEKSLEFGNFGPKLRFSRAQFAIYAGLSYQAIQQAVVEGRLEENAEGILASAPLTEEFLSRLSSNSQGEKTRETVRRLQLENEARTIRLEKEKNNLIAVELVEELYLGFMSRFANEMLHLGPRIVDHITAKIKSGLVIEQKPIEIADSIGKLIVNEVETSLKLIKQARSLSISAAASDAREESEVS